MAVLRFTHEASTLRSPSPRPTERQYGGTINTMPHANFKFEPHRMLACEKSHVGQTYRYFRYISGLFYSASVCLVPGCSPPHSATILYHLPEMAFFVPGIHDSPRTCEGMLIDEAQYNPLVCICSASCHDVSLHWFNTCTKNTSEGKPGRSLPVLAQHRRFIEMWD